MKGAAPVVPEKVAERFQSLPFESQQIGGLLAERMKVNVEKELLSIDEAAYLSGFIQRPKKPISGDLPPGASWVGEHMGKWLDAACNALRYSDNADLQRLADRMAAVLIGTQEPDGYLGTYAPNQRWTAWDVWTHKYNLIGLLSYYELSGDGAVLTACRKMGDLLVRTFGEAPGQRDIVFNAAIAPDLKSGTVGGIESTSVLEPICKLYRYSGDPRHLEFARYIVRAYEHPQAPNIVNLPIDSDSIARGKAYEMLSNLVGLVDLYRLTGEETLLKAVLRDWEDICGHQLYITGTTGSNENFQPPDRLLSLFSSGVGENCVTVTWLQLNWRLLRLTGEARFGQEIERTVYNQLLAAHDPQTGGFSGSTSLTGRKQFQSGLTCCVSSGKRGLSLLPKVVWGLEQNAFVINLYTSGRASFEIGGVPIEIVSETEFPLDGNVSLKIHSIQATRFTLRLRVPEWTEHFDVSVGSQRYRGIPRQMLDITQFWQPTSIVQIRMDLPTRVLSGAPTYPDYIALQRGPQVLAIERRLNPDVTYLHRTALRSSQSVVSVTPVSAAADWAGRQVYAVEGLAGVPEAAGGLVPKARKLLFIPFADAIDYRVWTTPAGRLRRDLPAVTAFALASTSPDKMRPRAAPIEAITDEDSRTFCTCDPRSYGVDAILRGALGKRGEPVAFIVTLDQPTTISRIVFRHGASTEQGGWFDTTQGKPQIEVMRNAPPFLEGTSFVDMRRAKWEKIAEIAAYPANDAASIPHLKAGETFEVNLPQPARVYAIRVVGRPGGEYASCAELAAYA